MFFADLPERAPALNKIPLVKWDRDYAYVSSTHMLLPRGLNLVYDEWGGEKASGCLLHAKFLDTFAAKAEEEMERGQHYANSHEYRAYRAGDQHPARSVVQVEREVHQLAAAGDSGADVERQLGMTVGFVMLCHTALDRAAQVARHWAGTRLPGGHPCRPAGQAQAPMTGWSRRCPIWPNIRFSGRHACEWGTWGIVAATQEASTTSCCANFPRCGMSIWPRGLACRCARWKS